MKILLSGLLSFLLTACGGETKVIEPAPPPSNPGNGQPGTPPPSGGKTSFADARQIMGTYCEGCHANSPWLENEGRLRNSNVKAMVKNGRMPPLNAPRQMGQERREQLLNFF